MTKQHGLFISSFFRDAEWFSHCLASIRVFARGFLPPVVCVSTADAPQFRKIVADIHPECRVVIRDCLLGRENQPFMRAQGAMLFSDQYIPEADILYWLGSDCLLTDTFTPDKYHVDGRPIVLYREYRRLDPLNWEKGTSRVLGFPVPCETMGRLPSVFPREVFEPMRRHVEAVHGIPFEQYLYDGNVGNWDTSEANILGAFAQKFMPETCEWINGIDVVPTNFGGWAYPVAQFWSKGGLDRPMECCATLPDGTNTVGRTPRSVIRQVLYNERA